MKLLRCAIAFVVAALAASLGFLGLFALESVGMFIEVPEIAVLGRDYETMVERCLILMSIGLMLVMVRSRSFSVGHELGRDAVMTLALTASVLPIVAGIVHLSCLNFVTCIG